MLIVPDFIAALVLPLLVLMLVALRDPRRASRRARPTLVAVVEPVHAKGFIRRNRHPSLQLVTVDSGAGATALVKALSRIASSGKRGARVRVHGVATGAAVVIAAAVLAPHLFRETEVVLETNEDLGERQEEFRYLPSATAIVSGPMTVPAWPERFAHDLDAAPFDVEYSDGAAFAAAA